MPKTKSNSVADQDLVPRTTDCPLQKPESKTEKALNELFRGNILAVSVAIPSFDACRVQPRVLGLQTDNMPEPTLFDLAKITEATKNRLSQLLGAKQKMKVAYDCSHVSQCLCQIGLSVGGPCFDIMLAAQLLKKGCLKPFPTLERLAETLLKESFGDLDRNFTWEESLVQEQIKMAKRRAALLLPLHKRLEKLLEIHKMCDVVKLEFDCLPAIVEMQTQGVKVDRSKLLQVEKRLTEEYAKHRSRLPEWITEGADIGSTEVLLNIFAEHGIHVNNASEWTLRTLKGHQDLGDCLISCRKVHSEKIFVEKLLSALDPETSRIHPKCEQIGTSTGRISFKSPPLQNVPNCKEIRACFIPEEGYRFVRGDFSQIELRIAAEISKDSRMIQAFQDGEDLHQLTASLMTRKPLEEISPEERQKAKALNFGLLYGLGAKGLEKYALTEFGIKWNNLQAEKLERKFFEAYPGLYRWIQKQTSEHAKRAETLGGRQRDWGKTNPKKSDLIKSPILGTAADILKLALGQLHKELEAYRAAIVVCIHDKIILEVDAEQAHEVGKVLKKAMENAGATLLKNVPAVAKVCISDHLIK